MKKFFKNAIFAGAAAAGIISGYNRILNLTANMSSNLSVNRGRFFNWRYGDIYYTKDGRGKPLLLIHDLNVCSSSYEWNKVIKRLAKKNTVYAIDLIGCGRSDKPNITYTNYLYVQLINDFIAKVIGRRTNVIATGKSLSFILMSCKIEDKYINKIIAVSPENIEKLASIPSKRRNCVKFILDTPVYGTFVYNMLTTKRMIRNHILQESYYKKHLLSGDIVNAYYHAAKSYDGHGKYLLASIKGNYVNVNIIPALQTSNHTICLIGGKENPEIESILTEYKKYNSSIECLYIDRAKTLPQLEQPDKFLQLVEIVLG